MNKRTKAVLGLLVSSALLTACGNGGNTSGGNDNGKTVLRFATWDNEEDLEAQQAMVDRFNESQENIQVQLEGLGADFDQVLTTGLGAGDAPDVMYMWNYPLYHDGLEPLDSYVEKEGADYKDNFYDTLWNYNEIDDKIYGIPVGYTTHALFYNKELFDKADVDYPTADWTWEEAHAAAKKIADSEEGVYGFVMPGQPDPYDYEMYLWSNGAEYADDEGTLEGHVNSPKSVEVFDFFQEMLKDGSAIASEGSGSEEMKGGTAAMYVYGAWGIDGMDESGIDYGIVEIPSFKERESVSILSSSGLAMSKDSKHKDAAWEFIKFWTNEEANKERLAYELPVLHSVAESENLEDDALRGPFYSMLERSQEFTPTSFKVDNWTRISENLELGFEEIFNPSSLRNPKETLDGVAK